MKKLLIGLVAVLVLVVAALFVAPPLLGNSLVKSRIVAAVKEATGRDLEIGDVSLAVLPAIQVGLSDLRLANAENMPTPEMLRLGRLDLELALFPLIGKQINVERLVIKDLAVAMEVNQAGEANWIFPEGRQGEPRDEDDRDEGAPLRGLRLGDVRLENARFAYRDLTRGQSIEADDVHLTAQLSDITAKLALAGGLVLNGKPVDIDVSVDSPQALMTGEPAKLAAAVSSELVNLRSDLGLAQTPQPAVDGTATVEIGSVGELLAWLEQPLPEDQPDPGPVRLAATFKTEGTKVLLQEAVIEGEALDLKADGSFESVGGLNKVALTVNSGVLDIDRYLPPPAAEAAAVKAQPSDGDGARRTSPIEAIPDEPIDLSALKRTEADVKIAMAGIKAAGYEVGALALTVKSGGGKLQLDLSQLALYGGGVTGTLGLDASGEGLGVEADFGVDKVDLGALSAVAAAGKAPIAGIASGRLTASGSGATPRALVQDLKGGLAFKVGAVDVKTTAAGTISGVDLAVDLPGLAQSPSITGQLVYNKRKVALDVGLDPLDKVLAGDAFALQAHVDSELLKLTYDGTVQQQPVPGLDGRFNFASPSVGKLAAWLGQPLDPKQPDPGPLKIDALFKSEGETVVLERAVIEGKDLQGEATGRVDVAGEVTKVAFDLKAGMLDIDRYLPPPAPAEAAGAEVAAAQRRPAHPLEAIPDEPFDLAALRSHEADISIALDGLRAAGFKLGKTAIDVKLAGGKLALEIGQLALYGGAVKGRVDLDGSGEALGLASNLSVSSLAVGDLARATGVEPAPLEGVMTGSLKATARGASPRALVAALTADLGVKMTDAGLVAMPEVAIASLDASLALPGLDQAASGRLAMTLNGRPLEAKVTLDSAGNAMRGEPFATTLAVTSDLIKASLDGTVQQQPVPGLDGTLGLDVASLGQLAAWLGQPLPDGQPDPGPLKVDAKLAADGSKVAITSASITGKAAQATASGSYDGSGEVLKFDGKLDVAKLDLNAYLPPPGNAEAAAAPADGGAAGWSDEPIGAFSGLKQAEGEVQVNLANVLYRQLQVQSAAAQVSLADGVLKADVTGVQLNPGQMTASAVVDGSGDAAAISYRAKVQDVESKPFLQAFADMDFLSGKLNFETSGHARGNTQKQIVSSLNGDGAFTFLDGAIEGFDLAGTLRNVSQLGMASGGEKPKTDFSELSGSFTITNGVLDNRDLKMLAPLVRVSGAGQVPLPPRTLDYNAEAKLVASLEGQGGSDALAGLPIPVHAYGSWDKLSYNIDYKSMFAAAAADPARLANLPADLKDKAAQFGVNLPIPGLGGSEGGGLKKALEGVTGGGESGGGLGGALEGILGGGKQTKEPQAQESPAPSEESPAPSDEPKEEQPTLIPDLGKQLKGLFN